MLTYAVDKSNLALKEANSNERSYDENNNDIERLSDEEESALSQLQGICMPLLFFVFGVCFCFVCFMGVTN